MYKNFPISARTVTIGERGDNRGKKGKGHQGTCIKDPWTNQRGGSIEGGRWGRIEGQRRAVGEK